MNAEFEELYQQVILDHSKRPRNYGRLDAAVHVDGDNPSCGDEIHLDVKFSEDASVEDIKFTGTGCAISQASASLMTVKLKGKSKQDAESILIAFTDVVTEGKMSPPKGFGDLNLFAGVRKFPQRVKCAMLAWRAFQQALETPRGQDGHVSTENTAPHCDT